LCVLTETPSTLDVLLQCLKLNRPNLFDLLNVGNTLKWQSQVVIPFCDENVAALLSL